MQGLMGRIKFRTELNLWPVIFCHKIDYYEKETIESNLPMMMEPKINEIFLRRIKRLRRLKELSQRPRSQISSSSFGSGSLSFSFDEDFLKDVDLQYSELMNDQSSQLLNEIEFSDEQHDIYDKDSNNSKKLDTLAKIETFNLKDSTIDHLVCDFREIDIESVINFYKDIKKSKNGSIILSQIIEEQQKLSKKESSQTQNNKTQKLSKLSSQNPLQKTKKGSSIQKQSLLSTYISIFGKKSRSKQSKGTLFRTNLQSTRTIAEECVNEYKRLWSTVENAQDQLEQRKISQNNKRERVREKAQRLLEGIKRYS